MRTSLAATPDIQALFASHLAYFRGEIEAVHEAARPLLASASCFEARVGAGLALSLCAMYQGDLALWQEAKRYIAGTNCYSQRERECLAFWLAATDSTILDNKGFPEDFCRGCFDFLPPESFPAARFFYAKYLYMEFNNSVIERNQSGESPLHTSLSRMLPPICELMISQTRAEGVLIAEIYLRLICAVAYHNIGNNALASVHIDRALALALPDSLYSPLAEYRQPLDFLMDERLNAIDPAALNAVRALNKRLMEGWVKLHNTILDRRVSKELTAREREVSRFAVYGLSNAEIAQRLCISIATVKQALWSAMDKTGAGNRSELADFI